MPVRPKNLRRRQFRRLARERVGKGRLHDALAERFTGVSDFRKEYIPVPYRAVRYHRADERLARGRAVVVRHHVNFAVRKIFVVVIRSGIIFFLSAAAVLRRHDQILFFLRVL